MSAAAGQESSRAQTALIFAIVALIWGSTWFVIRGQIAVVPYGWNVAWRFIIASAGMVVLARVRGDSLRMPPGGQRIAALVGLMQFCGNYEFVYLAEGILTSGVVAVLYALLLVPNAVLSRLWLGTRIRARFVVGSAIAVGGIVMLLLHEAEAARPGHDVLVGALLALGGLITASIANVAQATDAGRRSGAVPLMTWSMIWGAGIDIVYALVMHGPPVVDPRLSWWFGVTYLAIIGSVVTFPLYYLLIRRMGAGPAAYNGVVTPVIAMVLSTLFEGYRWDWLAAGGSVLALAGMVVALGSRKTG